MATVDVLNKEDSVFYILTTNKGTGKITPVFEYHAMNMCGGIGGIASHILNLNIRWRWSISCLSCFTPGERASCSSWVGSCSGHNVEKKKVSSWSLVIQPIAWSLYWLSYSTTCPVLQSHHVHMKFFHTVCVKLRKFSPLICG